MLDKWKAVYHREIGAAEIARAVGCAALALMLVAWLCGFCAAAQMIGGGQ